MADAEENVAGPPPDAPARADRPKSSKSSGFKWKQKRSDQGHDRNGDDYRDRDRASRDLLAPPRRYDNTDARRQRSRSPRRDYDRRDRDRDHNYRHRDGDSRPPRRDRDFESSRRESRASEENRKESRAARTADGDESAGRSNSGGSSNKPAEGLQQQKRAPAARAPAEPMIVVNVNDRMGSKTSVPCLASDTVGMFKMQVAAMIGRRPHEIRLQRQGQRPFKDHITLGDYEIHDGVQLDLEVDTGD